MRLRPTNQSAIQQGCDAAAKSTYADPSIFWRFVTPNTGESDADFGMRERPQRSKASPKAGADATIQMQATNAQILASYRAKSTNSGGKVARSPAGVLNQGWCHPIRLPRCRRILVDAALNHPDQDFTPSGDASTAPVSKYPIEMQTEALKHFNIINESSNP